MNKQIPSYLKLVTDTISEPPTLEAADCAPMTRVCRAFERATGWRLEVDTRGEPGTKSNLMWSAPVDPGVGTSPGHIRLFSSSDSKRATPPVALEQVTPLTAALGQMWGELLATRRALRSREAELATGVPLVVREKGDQSPPISQRLEGVLRAGAEAIGCQAAALYLLDPATTELKLRASWGLTDRRLADPARPLRGAVADLEALLGHAVVLSDDKLNSYWKVPEPGFGSCVCVPISSASMPLGTLWAFCHTPRDFTPAETNILEVVAGRLAADLERPALVDEAVTARRQSRQIAAVERSQQEQLPHVAPLVDGWEIAARAHHGRSLGSTFYDWFALADGAVAVLAGDSFERGLSGALVGSATRAVARAFEPRPRSCHALLEKTNSILWTGSAGSAGTGLFHAIVTPRAKELTFATAGPLRVLAIDTSGAIAVPTHHGALGLEETIRLEDVQLKLGPKAMLLAYGTSFAIEEELPALDEQLFEALTAPGQSAEKLVAAAERIVQAQLPTADRLVLVIQRRER